jgi:hypothetical protein
VNAITGVAREKEYECAAQSCGPLGGTRRQPVTALGLLNGEAFLESAGRQGRDSDAN